MGAAPVPLKEAKLGIARSGGLAKNSEGESEVLLALRRGQDPQHLSVLRHGATRDLDVLALEDLDDPLVRMRALGILRRHDLPDMVLDGLACDLVAPGLADGGVEEELELVDPLRRVHV